MFTLTPAMWDGKIPRHIDNSMRSAWRKCPTYFALKYLCGFQHKGGSIHLHAGGAMAAGLEAARRAFHEHGVEDEDECVLIGLTKLFEFYGKFDSGEHPKSALGMAGALIAYFFEYPMKRDYIQPLDLGQGKRGIEFSFALPLEIEHPESGMPLLYAGRADMLCTYDGQIWVEDDKTTGRLGPSWRNQWHLDSQMTGYSFAGRQFDIPVAGAIIRGTSILPSGKYGFEQVLSPRSDWEIDRWHGELHYDLQSMMVSIEHGVFSQTLDKSSCSGYGACEFAPVCSARHIDQVLENEYEVKFWDPLSKEA